MNERTLCRLKLKCGFKWYHVNPTADALALHCLKECCKHAWEFACFMRIVRCILSSLMHEKTISTRCWVQKCNVDTNIVYCLVNRCTKAWRQSKQTSARSDAFETQHTNEHTEYSKWKTCKGVRRENQITVSHGVPINCMLFCKRKTVGEGGWRMT